MGGVVSKVTDAVGLSNSGAASGAAGAAGAMSEETIKLLKRIKLPEKEKMMLSLELPRIVAELQQAEELKQSALGTIQEDPKLRDAQYNALQMLSERGQQGLTDEDKIAFKELRDQNAADESSRQRTMIQQMAERGTLDSGAQLAAQLSSSQAATTKASQEGDRMAKAALEGRREAMMQQANLASNMSQQDYGRQSDAAKAKDAIAQFNLVNRQSTGKEKQRVLENQVALKNQQQMFNKELEQRQFENEMKKAGAVTGAMNNAAQMAQSAAQSQSAANQGGMGGLLSAATSLAPMLMMSDKKEKEQISNATASEIKSEIRKLIEKLEPYSYNYKEGSGKDSDSRVGIMAQDLEKSDLGNEMVEEVNGVKHVDIEKAAGVTLAAASDLDDRVSRLEKLLSNLRR